MINKDACGLDWIGLVSQEYEDYTASHSFYRMKFVSRPIVLRSSSKLICHSRIGYGFIHGVCYISNKNLGLT